MVKRGKELFRDTDGRTIWKAMLAHILKETSTYKKNYQNMFQCLEPTSQIYQGILTRYYFRQNCKKHNLNVLLIHSFNHFVSSKVKCY